MKTSYKPERQLIEGNIIFCHGENLIGQHVDCIMKSLRKLADHQLEAGISGKRHPLIYLRQATQTEVIKYCI